MLPLIRCLSTDLGINVIRKDLNSSSLTIPKPDWESYCHKVADLIMSEQTPAKVMEVRGKFYELLSHCIPPTVILKVRESPRIIHLALVTLTSNIWASYHPAFP